jgi:hypothetical protein
MLYAFFWVIPRRLKFICDVSEHSLFHLHRQVGVCRTHAYLPMKMEQSVPKRRNINFRRRGITQKKAYKIFRHIGCCVIINCCNLLILNSNNWCRSQLPRGLRRRSAAARLLRLLFRIPPASWMSVCCECFVLSGRGLCDELITRPEESYQLWCVVVRDLKTS